MGIPKVTLHLPVLTMDRLLGPRRNLVDLDEIFEIADESSGTGIFSPRDLLASLSHLNT